MRIIISIGGGGSGGGGGGIRRNGVLPLPLLQYMSHR